MPRPHAIKTNGSNVLSPKFTPEQDAELLQLFRNEPKLFIEKFLQLRDKDTGEMVPFRLNAAQRQVYDAMQEMRREGKPVRLVLLKARQLGMSSLTEAILFTRARLWPNSNMLIVADRKESAEAIFSMFQTYYDLLPKDLRPMKRLRTKFMLRFENPDEQDRVKNPGLRSEIRIATARNPQIGRGFTLDGAHLSEIGFWDNPREALLSVQQAVPRKPDSYIIVESTANGLGGEFYNLAMRARKKSSEWRLVFLPWWILPSYELDEDAAEQILLDRPLDDFEREMIKKYCGDDVPAIVRKRWNRKIAWRRYTIVNQANNSVSEFDQEYPHDVQSAFRATGTCVFDWQAIRYYAEAVKKKEGQVGNLYRAHNKKVFFREEPGGKLTIWRHPQRGLMYAIGADAAMGIRGRPGEDDDENDRDYSAAVVLDWNKEQCSEFADKDIQPYDFAELLALLGEYYGNALVFPEVGSQGPGYGVQDHLRDIYPNIGVWQRWDYRHKGKGTNVLGFEPTSKTVPIVNSRLAHELRKGAGITDSITDDKDPRTLKLYSAALVDEMTTYTVHPTGRVGAIAGAHDDRLRALGIALLALDQIPSPHQVRRSSFDSRDEFWQDNNTGPDYGAGQHSWLAV